MTQIQNEIARIQVMADAIVTAFPESKAAEIFAASISDIEKIRATAEKEVTETGSVSSETYNAASRAMTGAEDAAWSLHDSFAHATTKLACRQLDNIHIMMNAVEGLPVPENHKCWPPEDPDCH